MLGNRWIALGFLLLLLLACNQNREPIRIVLIGGLSGKGSDLPIAGRNGAQMAVDSINATGGIHGRPLELIVFNHSGKPDSNEHEILTRLNEGDVFFVGPFISAMAASTMRALEGKNAVLITPTMTSKMLGDKDDAIFRLMPSAAEQGVILGQKVLSDAGKSVLIVQDWSNTEYTNDVAHGIDSILAGTGIPIKRLLLPQGFEDQLKPLADSILAAKTNWIVFLMKGADVALFAQRIHPLNTTSKLMGCTWAMTPDLLEKGGRTTEGMIFATPLAGAIFLNSSSWFEKKYLQRYERKPSFASELGWEAVFLFADAFKVKTDLTPSAVKAYLLQADSLVGIRETYRFNETGDAMRKMILLQVKDGQFQEL